jgi:hypothetical protein
MMHLSLVVVWPEAHRAAQTGDGTVLVDDQLFERSHSCTGCGRPWGKGTTYRWDAYNCDGTTVGTQLCETCQRTDPDRARLVALLDARYSPTRRYRP